MDTDATGTGKLSGTPAHGAAEAGDGTGRRPRAVVVMGVAGSGKTTVAALLAGRLGAAFAEGDDFHSPENVAKMAAGRPLTDDDRLPWLRGIRDRLAEELAAGRDVVVPCSSLRRDYRDLLRTAGTAGTAGSTVTADGTGPGGRDGAPGTVLFVHLTGSYDLLRERIQGRAGHFMKPTMLDSQLATLEPLQDDEPGIDVDVAPRPAEIVDEIQRRWSRGEG
ncbi:gluconokinase [Myceligenerans cantabricum]